MNDGLIPRMIAGYGMPEHLRITIGTETEVKAVRDLLQRFVAAQQMTQTPMFNKIALIGIGLIGGSIALDARKRGLANKIVAATRSAETAATANRLKLVDHCGTDLAAAAARTPTW